MEIADTQIWLSDLAPKFTHGFDSAEVAEREPVGPVQTSKYWDQLLDSY